MLWGQESEVISRFENAGIPKDNVSFKRDIYTFNFNGSPSEFVAVFKNYYGPTMNAFDAAEANGKTGELQRQLVDLFERQNISKSPEVTSIPAAFLRVTVNVSK
jgi:hypothetical protein